MLQKISDFIKSELQSMLKNRAANSQIFRGLCLLDHHRGAALGPRWGLASPESLPPRRYAPLQSPNVNSNNFLATSRKTFSGAMLHEYFNLVCYLPTL